ncbi:Voltage-gated Ion Channel (VIC) Superfamily [Thraustotheca clavata]|uniref:Voltage-gated Ion Channel (VIC) Superfamily n=1 Tax=Thraustotheca clavata TaxID=74557 RepID=A0A1W0AAE1_9STRA|nr:Voltage-gated Ion Channel (VIC) Superfamily [Thraustotheca clavata]
MEEAHEHVTWTENTPLLASPAHTLDVKLEVSSSVRDNQAKWKNLAESDMEKNSTAQDMANDIDQDLAELKANSLFDDRLPSRMSRVSMSMSRSMADSPIKMPNSVNKYMVAAAFMLDGIHGRKIGYRIDMVSLRLSAMFHSNWYRHLYNVIALFCCSLAFFERVQYSTHYLWIEVVCLVMFGVDIYIRYIMSSDITKKQFRKREPWATVRLAMLLLTILDIALYFAKVGFAQNRMSRMFRPFILIARRRNVRIVFGSCLRALKDVFVVIALEFCLIGFVGLIGFCLFADTSIILKVPYFSTITDSLYNILLISSCMPAMIPVMLPYFQDSEWSAIFFVIFILLSHFFLAKLTIAVSYRTYKKNTESMLYKRLQKRKIALRKAFDILKEEGCSHIEGKDGMIVSLYSWVAICQYLKPHWSEEEAQIVFYSVDEDRHDVVDFAQFMELSSCLVNANISKRTRHSIQVTGMHKWQHRVRSLLLAETKIFGYPVVYSELVVGFLIILSIIQATQVNNYALTYSLNHTWRLIGVVLLSLFTLEIALKLFAFGYDEFFHRPFCQLDLMIAVVGWAFYALTSLLPGFPIVFYDLALAIRSLRVIKLLNLFPPFHSILWTMSRILPLVTQLILVILSVVYAFAILAQANYGNILATFPEELKGKAATWYASRQEFQFDTFERALITMFEVATLACWNIVMDAAYLVTRSASTRIFFFTFRLTIGNILLPIFTGFLVESFSSNQKPVEKEETSSATTQMLPVIVDAMGVPDVTKLPRTSHVKYKMSFQRRASDIQSAMFDFSKPKSSQDVQLQQLKQQLNLVTVTKDKELQALRNDLEISRQLVASLQKQRSSSSMSSEGSVSSRSRPPRSSNHSATSSLVRHD